MHAAKPLCFYLLQQQRANAATQQTELHKQLARIALPDDNLRS